MKTLGIYGYEELQNLNVSQLKEYAFLAKPMKDDFMLYAVNTLPYYGVVVAVVYENRIIYTDLQLHYRHYENSLQAVKRMLEKARESVLTDAEMSAPLKDYNDFRARINYLNNIAPKKWKYVSMFHIGERSEEEKRIIKNGYACPRIGFCYFEKKEHADYINGLFQTVEFLHSVNMKDKEYFRKAVSYELANHEAGYTGEYEDGLKSLGLKFEWLSPEFQNIVINELNKQINR